MKHETETCPQEWKMPDQGDSHRLVSALNKIRRCYVCIVEVRGVAIARGVYFLFIIKFHGIGVIMKQQQRISARLLGRYSRQADLQAMFANV